jgi:hypothetical protein
MEWSLCCGWSVWHPAEASARKFSKWSVLRSLARGHDAGRAGVTQHVGFEYNEDDVKLLPIQT